jgi:hypothetical protein
MTDTTDEDGEWRPEGGDHTTLEEKLEATATKLSRVEQQMAAFQKHRLAREADMTRNSPPVGSASHVPFDDEPLAFPVSSGEEAPDEDTILTPRPSEREGKAPVHHRRGPLPDEACREAHELGDQVMADIKALAVKYGKPVQCILEEAGLKKIATRAEQRWNLHQKWYAFTQPRSESGESL